MFAAALYQRLEADSVPLPAFDVDTEAHALESCPDAPVAEAWREWRGSFDNTEDAAEEVGTRFAYLVAKRANRVLTDPSDGHAPSDTAGVRDLLDALDTAEEAARGIRRIRPHAGRV